MIAFVASTKPRSVNARKRTRYEEKIREACERYNDVKKLDGPLYSVVYYFHNVPRNVDADNISKPIWDSLRGLIYDDDRVICLRHAGTIDLSTNEISSLSLRRLPDNVAGDLIELIGKEDHVLYMEVGFLDQTMYSFCMECGGDRNGD